jgi:hypothetical protein
MSELTKVQNDNPDAENTRSFVFPCLLTVERSTPINMGKHKVSVFKTLLEDPTRVHFDGNILTIEYIDDGQILIKNILRENFVEWTVRHFNPEVVQMTTS